MTRVVCDGYFLLFPHFADLPLYSKAKLNLGKKEREWICYDCCKMCYAGS